MQYDSSINRRWYATIAFFDAIFISRMINISFASNPPVLRIGRYFSLSILFDEVTFLFGRVYWCIQYIMHSMCSASDESNFFPIPDVCTKHESSSDHLSPSTNSSSMHWVFDVIMCLFVESSVSHRLFDVRLELFNASSAYLLYHFTISKGMT